MRLIHFGQNGSNPFCSDSKLKIIIIFLKKNMKDTIFSDLNENAEHYDLCGVEFTSEDVDYVKSLMEEGTSYDDAIHECLTNIREVLN
jgi:hypothetical protein